MGEPKKLLPFGDTTFIERAVDTILSSVASELIVVVGYRADEVIAQIGSRPVRIARNPDYQQGMSTSISAGIRLVSPEAGAVLLGFIDQPLLDNRTIDRLIDGFLSSDKGIAVPTCRGSRGHPVIFSGEYISELMAVTGDIGGRHIISAHPDDVLEVELGASGVILDIDTREDYRSHIG